MVVQLVSLFFLQSTHIRLVYNCSFGMINDRHHYLRKGDNVIVLYTSYINGIRVVLLGPPSFLNGLLMHGTIFQLTLTFHHPSPLNVK